MPTRNVSLTDELDRYVEQSVQSGHYDNASEVVRAAIRQLRQSELEDKAKIEALTIGQVLLINAIQARRILRVRIRLGINLLND